MNLTAAPRITREPLNRWAIRRPRVRGIAIRVVALLYVVIGLVPQTMLRAQADDVGFPRWRLDQADSLLGLGALPSEALQGMLSEVGTGRTPGDWLAIVVYVAWLPVGLFTMWYVIRGRWQHYRSFALTWYGIWYLGLIGFVLIPVEPPWMLPEVERTLSDRVTGFVNVDPNQVAAFPSLHVGLPAALALQARAVGMRRWSQALLVFTGLTAFSVVHLGEHYVIDTLGGLALAWLVVRLSTALTRRAPSAEQEASELQQAA